MMRRFCLALPLLLLLGRGAAAEVPAKLSDTHTGTREKLVVAGGTVAMDLDVDKLTALGFAAGTRRERESFRFEIGPRSFFTILAYNNALRGAEQGSIELVGAGSQVLPAPLNAASGRLVLQKSSPEGESDLVLRDGKTGFVFFTVEGHLYEYDAATHAFRINDGRLLMSKELAKELNRPADAGLVVGKLSMAGAVDLIERNTVANRTPQPADFSMAPNANVNTPDALVPGPDVVVGGIAGLAQFGSSGTQVGLSLAPTSCNGGTAELDFFEMPNTDHPVIAQNLYRMSGGATNTERFEQVGQGWAKHAFGADQFNACGFGCAPAADFTTLGAGCSDPYDASTGATYSQLGSRAWVNPFTGSFPSTARNHTGHAHTGTSHRLVVEQSDLAATNNPGATYFAEVQYITPHEYVWCEAHPGECNMYNNASYRPFIVTGTTNFTFAQAGALQRALPAIRAWTGATVVPFQPAPGLDGQGFLGYKVTGPVGGTWHYEYAVLNQNIDRAIQSFRVPLGCGITVSNLGFHAPANSPGFLNDGTLGNAGFSNAPWTSAQTASDLTWSSETFAQNQNANAVRWGTLYNFRFDSNRGPQTVNATLGFFKTGDPITVEVQGPAADPCAPLQLVSAVSRKTHGSAGDFDINLPLTGERGVECRDGGGNYTIVVTFSNPMASGQASVTDGAGAISGTPACSGNSMTVNLNGVTDQQNLTVMLTGATDSVGQVLPNTAVPLVFLTGDTNGNKVVNASDVSQSKGQAGAPVTAANFRMDVNLSGTLTGSDIGQVKANAGHIVQ